jgi:hypothetical protein
MVNRKAKLEGAAAMSDDLNIIIGYKVQDTAEWRRRKASEFPDDVRNVVAAEELERLAAEISALEGSELHGQIGEAIDGINRICEIKNDGDVWGDVDETLSAELRSVGFHGGYGTGRKLLEWYRDLLREKLHELIERAVPVPDLDEQAANDPAVKAAKRAYDIAYAKAFAEARKRL